MPQTNLLPIPSLYYVYTQTRIVLQKLVCVIHASATYQDYPVKPARRIASHTRPHQCHQTMFMVVSDIMPDGQVSKYIRLHYSDYKYGIDRIHAVLIR